MVTLALMRFPQFSALKPTGGVFLIALSPLSSLILDIFFLPILPILSLRRCLPSPLLFRVQNGPELIICVFINVDFH